MELVAFDPEPKHKSKWPESCQIWSMEKESDFYTDDCLWLAKSREMLMILDK